MSAETLERRTVEDAARAALGTQQAAVEDGDEAPGPPALRPRAAGDYCGVSENALAMMRVRGTGPAFVRRGRLIYYPRSALDAWLAGE